MRLDSGHPVNVGPAGRKSFLTRLRRDTSGNTLAIVGAALLPLAAMIGSGVDMSRAYMAKTRLQSACDAAALAGRRIMTNDELSADVTAEANRFFNFNFPQGLYQTTAFTPVVTKPESGTVKVTASTAIPTAVMHLFGFQTLPLEVECDASLNFVNTDILLVLDVTGSMLENINGTKKITALQDAVMALYDELAPIQAQLEANGMRLRYGIVPYSSSVNVGELIREVDADYLSDDSEYQTRVANYSTPTTVVDEVVTHDPVVEVYPSQISQSDCDKYGRNVSFGSFTPSATTGGGPAPKTTWTRTFSNNEAEAVDWGYNGTTGKNKKKKGDCRRRYVQADTTYTTEYKFTNWVYEAESIDTSGLKAGNSIPIASSNNGSVPTAGVYDMLELAAVGNGVTTTTLSWADRCIIERDTVSTITSTSGFSIPDEAYDLDINLVPHNDQTRWRPFLPQITWRKSDGKLMTSIDEGFWACPSPARRLTPWTRTAMDNYVKGLKAVGGTYHDIGMIWGARLISTAGIFGDSPDEYNGMPVSRHIIFMTDGQLAPNRDSYTSYGIEQQDQRITGASHAPEQKERHLQRFRMICNSAKGQNVSIWVVAFATSLSSELTECASNANQASTSTNRDALIARFREIGSNIGALRLTL